MNSESQSLGQFIPAHYHHNMLRDAARMNAFKESIAKLVKPGARVLELGGGTGVLSFFAAINASKVWCVERNPDLVHAMRRCFPLNPGSEKIEIVEADAQEYLPPEPVDVVICEMLHVGMLREKQIQVINSFKTRYRQRFGDKLPIFIPEAFFQAVQPVEQNFDFFGYRALVPIFQDPLLVQNDTVGLGDPAVYQMGQYRDELVTDITWSGDVAVQTGGSFNALRFITKNIVGILVDENRALEWYNLYLILPLNEPLKVAGGNRVNISFAYTVGGSIDDLANSLQVKIL